MNEMKNSRQFTIEKYSDESIWLRSVEDPKKILYTINSREIFIGVGKGVIPIKNIDKITLEKKSSSEIKIRVHIKENIKWNETQSKKHPILWALRLISKSHPRILTLGSTRLCQESSILLNFFIQLKITIEEI